MTPLFTRARIDGFDCLQLSNATLSLSILPSVGGKIISLRSIETGREFLLPPRRPYARPPYGGAFADADFSGWDECFPAIAAGPYPDDPWQGTLVPDHGEVWTLPWSWRYRDGVLHMAAYGVRFPYQLERWLDLRAPDQLRVRYRARNLSPVPFRCLWSPHPMLAPAPSWRIILPATGPVLVDSSSDNWLGGYLDEVAWPLPKGSARRAIRLDTVGSPGQGYAYKVFATGLFHGLAGVHDIETGEALLFTFSPETIPYAGLAVATGSPDPAATLSYYAIVEPCNGWPDSLATAALEGACITHPPQGSRIWEFGLRIETAFSHTGSAAAGTVSVAQSAATQGG